MIPTNGPKKEFVQSWESSDQGRLADESLLDSFDPVIEVGNRFGEVAAEESPESHEILETLPESLTFDLGASLRAIPNKLFFRIGEVGELLDVKTYVLRFWETEFPMIQPTKSKTGQRVYRKKDVELLCLIKHLLYVERFSIEGAKKRIRDLKREGGLSPSLIAHGRVTRVTTAPVVSEAPVSAPAVEPGVGASSEAAAAPVVFGLSAEKKAALRHHADELVHLAQKSTSEFFRY